MGSGGGGAVLARSLEGDAVDEAEGTLAGDWGLALVAHDVDGHMVEALAIEQVGEADGLGRVTGETVLSDAICER